MTQNDNSLSNFGLGDSPLILGLGFLLHFQLLPILDNLKQYFSKIKFRAKLSLIYKYNSSDLLCKCSFLGHCTLTILVIKQQEIGVIWLFCLVRPIWLNRAVLEKNPQDFFVSYIKRMRVKKQSEATHCWKEVVRGTWLGRLPMGLTNTTAPNFLKKAPRI